VLNNDSSHLLQEPGEAVGADSVVVSGAAVVGAGPGHGAGSVVTGPVVTGAVVGAAVVAVVTGAPVVGPGPDPPVTRVISAQFTKISPRP